MLSRNRYLLLCVFFFQAEDGIRDLVRSRGLGDVYKRQGEQLEWLLDGTLVTLLPGQQTSDDLLWQQVRTEAVSYTHLTLPTSDLV